MSKIFNVGDDYVIAILTGIDDDEYASLQKVSAQVRSQVMRDKKYDYIVKNLPGYEALGEQAASLGSEVADFEGADRAASFYINGPGIEPRPGRRHRLDDGEGCGGRSTSRGSRGSAALP